MKYTSTRSSSISCSFEDAICSGYAPDGGLFVPESLPPVSAATLQEWAKLPYPVLSQQVLRLFIAQEEISDADLTKICTSAFRGFADPDHAVPVVQVGSLYIAELFHGPTFCFKDLGMQAVINLLSHFASQRQRKIALLVSTTGDTGPAALQAVSDVDNPLLTILVHYPDGQISNFQRRQLTTNPSPRVRVAAFQGGGDDMDRPIKNILGHKPKSGTLWTGVNSYNIGRPLMQMVHFVWTYLRVMEQMKLTPGDPNILVDVILPTGAMGNIAGGYMAKKMGVPLGKLNAGVNENDITFRVVQTGAFHKSPAMIKTLSDAINIQIPYNFERLLFYLTDGNQELVKGWMDDMDATSRMDLSTEWHERLQQEFGCERVQDDEMCAITRHVRDIYDYLVDPHTAVAIAAAEKLGYKLNDTERTTPAAIMATASPCKFQESVTVAIGEDAWAEYFANGFPESGKVVFEKTEIPPTIYEAAAGSSLEENQVVWEKMALGIIEELGQ
jgi:threonine synthase